MRRPLTYASNTPRPETVHSARFTARGLANVDANQLVPGADSWLRLVAASATGAADAAIHSLLYSGAPATSRILGAEAKAQPPKAAAAASAATAKRVVFSAMLFPMADILP